GVPPGGSVPATIAVSAGPAGDATRGAALYGASGANCAQCHGATGHGSSETTLGSMMYMLEGQLYAYPAPGLNAEAGNVAGDPDWNAALPPFSARSDVDNEGVTLRSPMPPWLTIPNPGSSKLLTTQDFADLYAFLQTQMQ